MLVTVRLLKALMRFADGDSFMESATTGVFRDMHGRPVLHCYALPEISLEAEARLREDTRRWLKMAASDLDLLEARLAAVGIAAEIVSPIRKIRGPQTRPQAHPGWLVPMVRTAQQWPIAVLTVALLSRTGDRDVLANRVGYCEVCKKFYLRSSSRSTRTCSKPCYYVQRDIRAAG